MPLVSVTYSSPSGRGYTSMSLGDWGRSRQFYENGYTKLLEVYVTGDLA